MFEEEKPSKGLFWLIGVLLLILIVGASTWFYLNRTPETATVITVTPTPNAAATVSDASDALVAELSSLDTELTDIETDTASGEDNAPNL